MVSELIPSPKKRITFFAFFMFQRYERDSASSLSARSCQCRLSAPKATSRSIPHLPYATGIIACKHGNRIKRVSFYLSTSKTRFPNRITNESEIRSPTTSSIRTYTLRAPRRLDNIKFYDLEIHIAIARHKISSTVTIIH